MLGSFVGYVSSHTNRWIHKWGGWRGLGKCWLWSKKGRVQDWGRDKEGGWWWKLILDWALIDTLNVTLGHIYVYLNL